MIYIATHIVGPTYVSSLKIWFLRNFYIFLNFVLYFPLLKKLFTCTFFNKYSYSKFLIMK